MSWLDILWMILNFVILFGGLWYLAKTPIRKAFENRRQKIADEIARAEDARSEARGLNAEIDAEKSEAAQKQKGMIEDARALAREKGAEIAAQGEQEAREIVVGAAGGEAQMRDEMYGRVGAKAVK